MKDNKYLSIADTCFLLHLFELESEILLDILVRNFDCKLSEAVVKEFYYNNKSKLGSIRASIISNVVYSYEMTDFFRCDYISFFSNFLDYEKIEEGEFHSAILSFYLSQKEKTKIPLFTNDFRAINKLSSFLEFSNAGGMFSIINFLRVLYEIDKKLSKQDIVLLLNNVRELFQLGLRRLRIDLEICLENLNQNILRARKQVRLRVKIEQLIYKMINGQYNQIEELLSDISKNPVLKEVLKKNSLSLDLVTNDYNSILIEINDIITNINNNTINKLASSPKSNLELMDLLKWYYSAIDSNNTSEP